MRGVTLLGATLRRDPDIWIATLEDVEFTGANILEVVGSAKVSRNAVDLLSAIENGEWLKLDLDVADSVGRRNVSTFEVKLWQADVVKGARKKDRRVAITFYGGFVRSAETEAAKKRSA